MNLATFPTEVASMLVWGGFVLGRNSYQQQEEEERRRKHTSSSSLSTLHPDRKDSLGPSCHTQLLSFPLPLLLSAMMQKENQ